MATDPVCGMQVDERTAAGSSVFEGSNYYFCCAGCKKKFEANPSAYVGAPPPAGDTTTAAKDPVCGMTVNPATARNVAHAGANYYFCSASCETKFRANPTQFLVATASPAGHEHHAHAQSPPTAPKTAAAGGKVTYTCPMHPEVLRDAPGDCPICGMALVPIAGTGAGQADDSELRDLARRLWVGVALSIPLVVLAMSPMIGIHELFGLQPRLRGWIEFVLGTPVVLWVGWPILRKFWFSLVHRALNM